MEVSEAPINWLRGICSGYSFEPRAILRRSPKETWPLTAADYSALETKLGAQGNLAPLPRESAAIANVIEVSVADFIQTQAAQHAGVQITRGKERHYPDLEITGSDFGGGIFAVDIKVARRKENGKRTESRISLYTGNTYFRYPDLKWPLTLRRFGEYAAHIDLIVLYGFDRSVLSGIRNLEILVHDSWRIASKSRSSTTREYIGAVDSLEALRKGEGEFPSQQAFLAYWRKFPFKIGRAVQLQLDKLLASKTDKKT